jgi:hypothetical protein
VLSDFVRTPSQDGIAQAERVAIIVDAQDYFRAAKKAILQAEKRGG